MDTVTPSPTVARSEQITMFCPPIFHDRVTSVFFSLFKGLSSTTERVAHRSIQGLAAVPKDRPCHLVASNYAGHLLS